MNKSLIALCATLAVLAVCHSPAIANVTYTFDNITHNTSVSGADFYVEVSDAGANQALFTFTNLASFSSSLTDVYFDNGTLLGIAYIDNTDVGVSFSQYATPGNLPGGNGLDPDFETSAGFSADSDPAIQPNGVNPGDTVGILFDLQSGGTYNDVIAELLTGEIRIGIRVQALPGDESDGFVNTGPPPIPAPGAFILGSLGIGLVGWLRKRTAI